jgi:hypothetical protein
MKKINSLDIRVRQMQQNNALWRRMTNIFDNSVTIFKGTKNKKQQKEIGKLVYDVHYLINAHIKGQEEITNMELEQYK